MAANNDLASRPTGAEDLSALSWVHDELRRSLELANKALRRYLKEQEQRTDLDTVDPAVLRQARSQLHQSVGVLELVGLGPAAQVLRAAEAALQRLSNRPKLITAGTVDMMEQGTFALLDFISRRLAGKPVSTLSLFPQYRALQEIAGATRVHPADLWAVPWSWREVPLNPAVQARAADQTVIGRIESDLLAMMRGAAPTVGTRMCEVFLSLAAQARQVAPGQGGPRSAASRQATLWQLAAGFYEAQADGLLRPDTYMKRVGSKLLAQLRAGPGAEPSERLAHDLLFFCSQAVPHDDLAAGAALAAVRTAYALDDEQPVDYQQSRLGRFDPAWLAQAHKRVAAAKEVWSAVAGGDLARLAGLPEQFSLVSDSLERLFSQGAMLGRALLAAAAQVVSQNTEPSSDLAMEVATALLFIDASIDEGDFDHPESGNRITRLAYRVDAVRQGRDPGMLELWMEELYRRVSDRQTMGSVVHELRAALSEVEKHIDEYFRDPARREVLIPVPAQLSAMRGVLSVLGLDQASQAVVRMRDDVDALANTEVNPQRAIEAGTFDRLADNLGALSFLIDMVSVQPQMAKSLFQFDPATGSLSSVMAREDRPSGFEDLDTRPAEIDGRSPADTDTHAVTLEFDRIDQRAQAHRSEGLAPLNLGSQGLPSMQIEGLLGDDKTLRMPMAAEPEPAPAAPSQPVIAVAAPLVGSTSSGLEDDPEMREVFLEEAIEVLQGAREALQHLDTHADDSTAMTTVRRAFHTLKGSARMVGLGAFGEAAWSCEQLYNARLAEHAVADDALRVFTAQALDHFEQWVTALAAGDATAFLPATLSGPADALRERRETSPAPSQDEAQAQVPDVHDEPHATPLIDPRLAEPDWQQGQSGDDLGLASTDAAAGQTEPAHTHADDAALAVLSLDELDEQLEPDASLQTAEGAKLAARVPGLPSAADLDLSLPAIDLPGAPVSEGAASPDATIPVPQVMDELAWLDGALGDEASLTAAATQPEPGALDDLMALDLPALAEQDLPAVASFETTAVLLPTPSVVELPDQAAARDESSVADLDLEFDIAEPVAPATEPVHQATSEGPLPVVPQPAADGEEFRQIGPLRISIPLFNIYLNEADELSRRLGVELAEWALEQHREVGDTAVALAHSLAGNSATVGYTGLSQLARELEHALGRSQHRGQGMPGESELFVESAEEIRRLLHLFAAGFLNEPDANLLTRLRQTAHAAPDQPVWGHGQPAHPAQALPDAASAPAELGGLGRAALMPFTALSDAAPRANRSDELDLRQGLDEDIDQLDLLDDELFPLFEEEAQELLPKLHAGLREWSAHLADAKAPSACMRSLHTFKGSARLSGAMRLGEMAHRLESLVERLAAQGSAARLSDVQQLIAHADALETSFLALGARPAAVASTPDAVLDVAVPASPSGALPALSDRPVVEPLAAKPANSASAATEPVPTSVARVAATDLTSIDWGRFQLDEGQAESPFAAATGVATGSVRVRTPLLDRLVNHAGEVSIARARIESDVNQLKGGLGDLTDNLERMRAQLRDIELQAETQIGTRMEAARAAAQEFDPLEMDRFTRFQELTRMMAESVADVATWQRGLQRTLQSTEDALAHQARTTRDMQDDLLRTRMVEFEGLSERLYRVVRQAAKETGKPVRLDILGGSIEIDRGVLDRMTPAFEHLLRNSVVHGIEAPAQREAAGKDATGTITLSISQVGNEVGVEVRDDGAGLDLARIRERGTAMGLLAPGAQVSDAEIANLIFQPGVTTASSVTDLAGRGVGMDVVRTDINAMGGRIETASAPGQGTSFRLVLPLTTAVTQVVMLRCHERSFAVPATLVEIVRRAPSADIERAYSSGLLADGAQSLPFFWLDGLLSGTAKGPVSGRTAPVVIIRSANQRVALHVDEVLGNQEVVVKNLGPQLSRVPGLVGMTLLPSGQPALIYNPVALATLYGDAARAASRQQASQAPQGALAGSAPAEPAQLAPLVLVVDDSLTVRRVTQRLLEREGYRVVVAKDGLDGLEKLAQERPAVLLTDIEMPRMDGFDLVRNLRSDAQLAQLPVIMITSRIAQKHRDYAVELGVDHYLGKPYAEDELLGLVAGYAKRAARV